MPPIRSLSTAKPVKTERTHEENQERAYIAASRRSDRSLEARIESARRASEIHKKRTGRSLRVTETDVVNEEMYEEEDDDLPTQYQRLSAHLQTNSLMFNRKLHDYITTQTAVRNQFMQQQYPYGNFPTTGLQYQQGINPFMGHQMPPPSMFSPSAQTLNQPTQAFSPSFYQHTPQGYRQSPYPVPQRPQPHQRSASISTPQQMPSYQQQSAQLASGVVDPPQSSEQRRQSLPPKIDSVPQQMADGQTRPPLSRTNTSQSGKQESTPPQHSSSPHGHASASTTPPSGHGTPTSPAENTFLMPYSFMSMNNTTQSQVVNMNPLSMSLPPESQQFVGSALESTDPSTAIFMAGSDSIPQPFKGTYHYNPNVSPKSSRAWAGTSGTSNLNTHTASTANSTVSPSEMSRVDTTFDGMSSADPTSATSEHISPSTVFTPAALHPGSFFDLYNQEEFDTADYLTFSD